MRISDWSSDVCSSDLDKTTDEMKEELGFYTDVKTRPLIIDELRQAVREEVILLNDATTIDEMITFVADPKSGKIEAEVGCHDDCVMALAIANQDRKSVVQGKSVSVRVDLGGRLIIQKTKSANR